VEVALVCQERLQLFHGICLNFDRGYEMLLVNLGMLLRIGRLRSPRRRDPKSEGSVRTTSLGILEILTGSQVFRFTKL
jgi:hypothetical protein